MPSAASAEITSPATPCDAVVVGSGLGGLSAAVRLQAAGKHVVLLERHGWAGGHCGAFDHGGFRFTRGCNEFGGGMAGLLRRLGVVVPFVPSTTLLSMGGRTWRLPPDLATAGRLLWRAPALLRLVQAVRRAQHADLGAVLRDAVRDDEVAALASVMAYAAGVPPSAVRTRSMLAELQPELGYELSRQVVPVGGAQAIVDGLVGRFQALGGTLLLGADCQQVSTEPGGHRVRSSAGTFQARQVITSQAHDALKPRTLRRGLSASQLLFAVPASFPRLRERSFAHMPLHADRWIGALDQGEMPEDIGFHLFRDQITSAHVTYTGFCMLPRGEDQPSEARVAQVLDHVRAHVDRVLPGFGEAVQHQALLGPAEYARVHGVRSELSRVVEDDDWQAPDLRDPRTGLLHIGNGLSVPGQHAMAAALSGSVAADRVLAEA